MSRKYVLVHGAWQGEWAWQSVAEKLRSEGEKVLTFDLPGSGKDLTLHSDVTLTSYAETIIARTKALSIAGDVTLVGHSMGGAAVTLAAALAPELFSQIVYICAFVPRKGESVAVLGEESKRLGEPGPSVNIRLEQGVAMLAPERIPETFFNDCYPDKYLHLIELFGQQPLAPIVEPISQGAESLQSSKTYILCTQDKALSPTLQRLMAERVGISDIRILESGHEPFISVPDRLLALLTSV